MNDDSINIRDIQHYMYCPRRFGLLAINQDWEENVSVIKANIMHEHVHDGSHDYSSKDKIVKSSVTLYNDDPQYNIFGVADCLEFEKDDLGVYIPQNNYKYSIKIVEYKPNPPKDGLYHESDAIQVYAQKMCVDYIWHCDCEGYLYYSETRKRVHLPFSEKKEYYNNLLIKYLSEMREIIKNKTIPSRPIHQECSGCSMKDVCLAKTIRYNVHDIIMSKDNKV